MVFFEVFTERLVNITSGTLDMGKPLKVVICAEPVAMVAIAFPFLTGELFEERQKVYLLRVLEDEIKPVDLHI